MITELRLIRNIGKYENCSGAPGLKKISLIYSENARGKTTLTAILRSLAENEPAHIAARQRLGTTNQPEIRITSSQGSHVFRNGAWDTSYPSLLVFDDHFVDRNVYSGLAVGREQCDGLHEVILGAQSITLAQEIEQVVGQIVAVNGQIRQAQANLQPHAAGMGLDEFIALEAVTDADQHIQIKQALLAQIGQAEPIRQQEAFGEIELPRFAQQTLAALLALSLEDVEQAAIASVEQHFGSLGQMGEQWTRTGLTLSEDRTTCPFCDQDIQNNALLDSYRAYFSQEYERHTQNVVDQTDRLLESLVSAISSLRQASATTEARRTFWSQYITDLPPAPDYEAMADSAQALHDQLQEAFQQKRQSPLAIVDLAQTLLGALTAYPETRNTYVEQQIALLSKNSDIQQIKSNARAGDRQQVESDLRRLRAAVTRHTPTVVPLVEDIQRLRQQKNALEADRARKRAQLDEQRLARFPQYQASVNSYLRQFGADFEITSVTPDNRGTAPSVRYGLKVNDTDVDVSVFRNTLSAGDRSTLALAYFFAMVDGQQDLSGTVVAIDDPFTSMDKHRAHATVQEIRSLRTTVEQLIVLSHDSFFLWKIQEPLSPRERQNDLSCLEVVTDGGWAKSTLSAWDIAEQERTLYDDNHERLRDFSEHAIGDTSATAPLLRPVMESYCRVAFPKEYPPGKRLGQFRSDEMQRRGNEQGLLDDHDFGELCEITDYANQFHHATDLNCERNLRNANATELKRYVDRVLEFTKYRQTGGN